MPNIGLIVGRSGSKTLLNKNIRLLGGKPLVAYAIEAAIQSKRLDEIIVSTDCPNIADIAIGYGLKVPSLRPSNLAQDKSSDYEVITHAVNSLLSHGAQALGSVSYLRPTTPFKNGALIDACIQAFEEKPGCLALRTITKCVGSEHPLWQFQEVNGVMQNIKLPGFSERPTRRQDLPPVFRVNGVVDIVRFKDGVVRKNLFWDATAFHLVKKLFSVDIDDEYDFVAAEALLKYWRSQNEE